MLIIWYKLRSLIIDYENFIKSLRIRRIEKIIRIIKRLNFSLVFKIIKILT
jgi:hypothetical protein